MIRRLIMVGAMVALPLGFLVATAGSSYAPAPTYNDTADFVNCGSFIGSATVEPALALGGTSPTTIAIKGDVYGCTDGQGQMNQKDNGANPYFYGKVSGTLDGANNDLTTLQGCSVTTGNLTVAWDATANGSEHLAEADSIITVSHIFGLQLTAVPSPFNQDGMNTPGYGEFLIGYGAVNPIGADGANCPSSTTQASSGTGSAFYDTLGTGGYGGGTVATTAGDINGIIGGQFDTATKTTLTLGLGAFYDGAVSDQ